MSLKINEDPVSTPASEWAEQTTNALGSSTNKILPRIPAQSSKQPSDLMGASAGSTATTPGVDLPGGLPRTGTPNEPITLPDLSQQIENAKEYVASVDLSQHVETVKQYLPAREDVEATVVNVAQIVGQYLPESVVNAAHNAVEASSQADNGVTELDPTFGKKTTDGPMFNPGEQPVKGDAALLDPTSTASLSQPSQPASNFEGSQESLDRSHQATPTDSNLAAHVPLPHPKSSFFEPTVDVTKDEDSGSPVVTVHPEASPTDVNEGTTTTNDSTRSGIDSNLGERDIGMPNELPSLASTESKEPTVSNAPTGLEKPVTVPISGALSPPLPPPKDTSVKKDQEERSTSSDPAIPSTGSEDKVGGVNEGDDETDGNGKERKGASKLLGKMKEKLKGGQKA